MKRIVAIGCLTLAMTGVASAASKTYDWRGPDATGAARVRWCGLGFPVCGKPMADLFCQRRNFAFASDFAKDTTAESLSGNPRLVGIPGTYSAVLLRKACHSDRCSTFAFITCDSASLPAKKAVKRKKK